MISNPEMTAEEIAIEVGVTKRTIERTLVSLKKKGLIERIGSNKNGSWAVIQGQYFDRYFFKLYYTEGAGIEWETI